MPKIFQTIVKRVTVAAGSGNGFVASVVKVGVSFANLFSLLGGTVLPAVSVDATRQANRIAQTPGFDTDLLGATGDAARPVQAPGVDVDASMRDVAATSSQQNPALAVAPSLRGVAATGFQQNPAVAASLVGATGAATNPASNPAVSASARISEFHVDEAPACEIVQVTYNLTRRVGANAAANTGAQAWTNPNNGNGIHDATTATHVGNLTAAHVCALQLDYANHVAKTSLTITQVNLHYYVTQTGTVAANGDLRLRYNVGAGLVTLATSTGDVTPIGTPQTFDITAAVAGDWAKLDALQTVVEHRTDIGEILINAAVDAVEVEILANVTQVP